MWQNTGQLEAMEKPRSTTDTVIRVASIEVWCLQMLSWGQAVAEVEAVWTTCHAYLLELVLLDAHLPGPTPPQCSEPDVAAVLIVRAISVDRKPRIILITCRSATALENDLSGLNRLLVQIPLTCPSTSEVTQAVVRSARQIPCA